MSARSRKHNEKYAAEDHLPRRMLRESVKAHRILAASPYITEDRLFKRCDPKAVTLYTTFDALTFASGASSIRILKLLSKKGISIFQVQSLHAKAVLIDGKSFSLGSQNLTRRGRKENLEASFVSGHDTPTAEVEAFFARIHSVARPISLHDIVTMEKLIARLLKKFKELELEANAVDEAVEASRVKREATLARMRAAQERKRREAQERARQEAEKATEQEKQKRLLSQPAMHGQGTGSGEMRRAISNMRRLFDRPDSAPDSRLIAAVKRLQNGTGWFTTSTQSLQPVDRDRDFLQLLRSIGVKPKRLSRYLVVNTDNGRLGWVRFAKTRWTYFGQQLSPHETLPLGRFHLKTKIVFNWDELASGVGNGTIHLSPPSNTGRTIASVRFAFSVSGVELVGDPDFNVEKIGMWNVLLKRELTTRSEFSSSLIEYLVGILTMPFRYQENLYGYQASEFFKGTHHGSFQIQAHKFKDTAIFTARQHPLLGPRMLPVSLGDLFS